MIQKNVKIFVKRGVQCFVCFFFTASISNNLHAEFEQYNDMIVIRTSEAYSGWQSSLPIKTAVWFQYVQQNMLSVQYVVKTDDDSYVRVLPLINSAANYNLLQITLDTCYTIQYPRETKIFEATHLSKCMHQINFHHMLWEQAMLCQKMR